MKILETKLGWARRATRRDGSIMIVVKLDDGRPRTAHVEFDPGEDFGDIYPLEPSAYDFREIYVRSTDLESGATERLELPAADVSLVVKAARNYIVTKECFTEVQFRWNH